MTSAPNVTQAVPFFFVRDIEAAIKFYTERSRLRSHERLDRRRQAPLCWLELGVRGDAAGVLDGRATPQHPRSAPAWEPAFTYCRDAFAIYTS